MKLLNIVTIIVHNPYNFFKEWVYYEAVLEIDNFKDDGNVLAFPYSNWARKLKFCSKVALSEKVTSEIKKKPNIPINYSIRIGFEFRYSIVWHTLYSQTWCNFCL